MKSMRALMKSFVLSRLLVDCPECGEQISVRVFTQAQEDPVGRLKSPSAIGCRHCGLFARSWPGADWSKVDAAS